MKERKKTCSQIADICDHLAHSTWKKPVVFFYWASDVHPKQAIIFASQSFLLTGQSSSHDNFFYSVLKEIVVVMEASEGLRFDYYLGGDISCCKETWYHPMLCRASEYTYATKVAFWFKLIHWQMTFRLERKISYKLVFCLFVCLGKCAHAPY